MSDPEATSTIEFMVSRRVVPVLARQNLIRQMLSAQFDRTEDEALLRLLGLAGGARSNDDLPSEAERLSAEQPVVKLVAQIIDTAIQRRASDIHVRPGAETFELL